MPNSYYERAKQLRAICEQQMPQVLPALTELRKNLAEYYEIMRWQNLDCTTKEYEKLYDNLLYPYEQNDIDYRLEQLIAFLTERTSEATQ